MAPARLRSRPARASDSVERIDVTRSGRQEGQQRTCWVLTNGKESLRMGRGDTASAMFGETARPQSYPTRTSVLTSTARKRWQRLATSSLRQRAPHPLIELMQPTTAARDASLPIVSDSALRWCCAMTVDACAATIQSAVNRESRCDAVGRQVGAATRARLLLVLMADHLVHQRKYPAAYDGVGAWQIFARSGNVIPFLQFSGIDGHRGKIAAQ